MGHMTGLTRSELGLIASMIPIGLAVGATLGDAKPAALLVVVSAIAVLSALVLQRLER
jgi:di/tricarboxylate transporter